MKRATWRPWASSDPVEFIGSAVVIAFPIGVLLGWAITLWWRL